MVVKILKWKETAVCIARQAWAPAILLWTVLCRVLFSLGQKQLRPGGSTGFAKAGRPTAALGRGSTRSWGLSVSHDHSTHSPPRNPCTVLKVIRASKHQSKTIFQRVHGYTLPSTEGCSLRTGAGPAGFTSSCAFTLGGHYSPSLTSS